MEWLHISAKEYKSWGKKGPSKYHAQKETINGVEYDSKKEAKRAQELEYLERLGKIKNLQKQVRFILQEGYVNNEGQKVRPISYVADFVYEENGQKVVEDVKSHATRTEVYKIKRKLFQYRYQDYRFLEFL